MAKRAAKGSTARSNGRVSRGGKGRSAKADAKAVASADAEECAHSWEIGRPNQQVSLGTCTKCGAEKKFLNYGEELRMPFGRRRRRSA